MQKSVELRQSHHKFVGNHSYSPSEGRTQPISSRAQIYSFKLIGLKGFVEYIYLNARTRSHTRIEDVRAHISSTLVNIAQWAI